MTPEVVAGSPAESVAASVEGTSVASGAAASVALVAIGVAA